MTYNETTSIDDVLAEWDRGGIVWSVEMGGLGPGYEQAIQVLAIELLRDMKAQPLPLGDTFGDWGDATVSRINSQCLGFSGAQVGAAKSIAYRIIRDGYHAALQSAPDDRRIQISNCWPQVKA